MEVNLPDNFDVAFGQIRSLAQNLQNDWTLLGQYNGIKVENELKDVNEKHYLPHHPVVTQPCYVVSALLLHNSCSKALSSSFT